MTTEPVCIHCRQRVRTITVYGGGGTRWVHWDGYEECPLTYASPSLDSLTGVEQ